MNWDAIGAIGEIVGATAVVISLIYLAIQFRTNSNALKSSASWDSEIAFAQRNDRIARDPFAGELLSRAFDPDTDINSFSDTERLLVFADTLSILQTVQAQYFVWKSGNLPDEIWDYRSLWIRSYILLPVIEVHWENIKSENFMAQSFIDNILAINEDRVWTLPKGAEHKSDS